MKLVVYYPGESFLQRAEEAWQRFVEQVQPPPVEVTIYWGQAPQPLADATTEAEAVQDLPGDPRLILRLSAEFFRLSPSGQMVTLLHGTIRMSLELEWKRFQQADDLSKGHFQGKTRSEQAFETQRIQLARGLYLFPDEGMAEKRLQQDYPAFAADRLGHYNDVHGRASENRDCEAAEPGLEWPAALWFWLRNKLGTLMATTDELGTAFGDRVTLFDARLRDLLPGDEYRRVTELGRRLLAAGSGSPSFDGGSRRRIIQAGRRHHVSPAASLNVRHARGAPKSSAARGSLSPCKTCVPS